MDPVFLLDAKEWDKICSNYVLSEKYILVYDFDGNSQIEQYAKSYASDNQLKIYSVFKVKYADKTFENIGPIEFISLIKNADFIVSNLFHATAFSIIYRRPFAVFDRNENINTRMRDLIGMFGLKMINKEINEEDLSAKINYYRQLLCNYIDSVLKGAKC